MFSVVCAAQNAQSLRTGSKTASIASMGERYQGSYLVRCIVGCFDISRTAPVAWNTP